MGEALSGSYKITDDTIIDIDSEFTTVFLYPSGSLETDLSVTKPDLNISNLIFLIERIIDTGTKLCNIKIFYSPEKLAFKKIGGGFTSSITFYRKDGKKAFIFISDEPVTNGKLLAEIKGLGDDYIDLKFNESLEVKEIPRTQPSE